jgi:hypothetical protein
MRRQIHATEKVHDNAEKIKTLKTPILDYGFMEEKERLEVFARHKRAGRIAGFTKPLVEKPILKRLPPELAKKSREFCQ